MPALQTLETMDVDLTPTLPNHSERGNDTTNGFQDTISSIDFSNRSEPSHLNSVFEKCRNLACEQYKADGEEQIKKFADITAHARSIVFQTEECRKKISDFIQSKSFLFTTPIDSLKLHPQFKTFNANNIAVATNGASNSPSKEQSIGDVLEVVTVVPKAKTNLPPAGEVKRKELHPGTEVWVMKTTLEDPFVEGTILSGNDADQDKLFKVRFEETKSVAPKLFTAKQLAYRTIPEVILPVGTRIVARYSDGIHQNLYAGIIAEPPKITNTQRYLVFFDDAYAQYLEHGDVYLMCAQSVDVADDVFKSIREFIRAYLLKYPERPMVKLQKNQITKTEFDTHWCDTKVLEVDASMVKVHFLGTSRTEWIYRGSTRIKLLYNELRNAAERRMTGKHLKHNIVPRKPHQPYVEYTREEEIVTLDSDSDTDENKGTIIHPRRKTGGSQFLRDPEKKIRNTARKSTCMKARQAEAGTGKYHPPDIKSHLGYKDMHNLVSFSRVKYKDHNCGFSCREKDDPVKFKGRNPFLIPVYLGWERQLRKYKKCGPKIIVTYRTPCGRHLRDMKDILNYLILVASRITIDFFSLDSNLVVFRTFRPREIQYEDRDVTQGKENVPVCCVNSWSREKPPFVEYAAKRFPGKGVYLNEDKEFLCGCSCTDNCQNSERCDCQNITNYAFNATTIGDVGYKFKRLKEPIITGIYECNDLCKCGPQCGNRVVQNGLQARLQMFKTEHKGWGIRCLDDLDAGMFICIYAGQLLTEQGADADGNQYGDEYLAELDHIEVVEKTKEGYEPDVYDVENVNLKAYTQAKKEEEDSRSEEPSPNSSDSELNACETDSDFESTLRNTAVTNYTTRSRKRKRAKNYDSSSNVSLSGLNIAEDSSSNYTLNNKSSKELPDISTALDSYAIVPRPLSPVSAQLVENTQLKRNPKLSENGLDLKSVAKKSFNVKYPMSSVHPSSNKQTGYKTLRSYHGEDSLYIMDAKSKGNIGRYLNHSCAPNVFVQNVFVNTHDLRFPEVAFFAQNFIQAGTELTWDYNYEVGSVSDKVMYCYCDARTCRGRLL